MELRLIVQALRLLHGGCKMEADPRCVLVFCLWHSGGECLPPQASTCGCFALTKGLTLRLIEQACGCSTVQDRGGLKSCL